MYYWYVINRNNTLTCLLNLDENVPLWYVFLISQYNTIFILLLNILTLYLVPFSRLVLQQLLQEL